MQRDRSKIFIKTHAYCGRSDSPKVLSYYVYMNETLQEESRYKILLSFDFISSEICLVLNTSYYEE